MNMTMTIRIGEPVTMALAIMSSAIVLLRQYYGEGDEAILNRAISEEDLAILLEEVYPQIVAYDTMQAYQATAESVDVNYWIDFTIGANTAKAVADSEGE